MLLFNSKALLLQWKPRDATENFDTYRHLQQHRVVLPAIALLSCLITCHSLLHCSWTARIALTTNGAVIAYTRQARLNRFYRAMHFSAKRGIAIVYCPSVSLSVSPCVTFRYRDHIGWNSSKIISWPNSLRPLLPGWPQHGPSGTTGTPQKLGLNMGVVSRERKKNL